MSQLQYHQTAYARVHAMGCSSAPNCLQLWDAEEVLHSPCGRGNGTKLHATLASGAVLRSQTYGVLLYEMEQTLPIRHPTLPYCRWGPREDPGNSDIYCRGVQGHRLLD